VSEISLQLGAGEGPLEGNVNLTMHLCGRREVEREELSGRGLPRYEA
jgi:hypothetical protein